MEKTRVPKGEKYWWVWTYGDIDVCADKDNRWSFSTKNYNNGNYFHTKEEAEEMARKLRAVLKGADVIEMPSEEEYEKIIPQRIGCSHEFAAGEGNGYWRGYNYLKSKIVK